jgi:hypothetical protein
MRAAGLIDHRAQDGVHLGCGSINGDKGRDFKYPRLWLSKTMTHY